MIESLKVTLPYIVYVESGDPLLIWLIKYCYWVFTVEFFISDNIGSVLFGILANCCHETVIFSLYVKIYP